MTAEAVSFSEFARRVGVSKGRVSQLVADGRLPTLPGPKKLIPYVEGLRAWRLHRAMTDGVPVEELEGEQAQTQELASRTPPALPQPSTLGSESVNVAEQHAKARAADKIFQAKTRELKYEALKGTLVLRADVDADAENVGALIRSSLLTLPGKLAPQLSGRILETAAVEAVLVEEIESVLLHLYESRYSKGTPKP